MSEFDPDAYINMRYPNPAENRFLTCCLCNKYFEDTIDPEDELCTDCYKNENE